MSETHVQESTRDLRSKTASLYTFLKEFARLRTKTVRSIDEYEEVLWFSDIPREAECDCATWHRGQDQENPERWLEVRQPRLRPAPEPSEELSPWLVSEQVADSARDMPEIRDEIAVLREDNESGEECFVRQRIEDHPEVKAAWETYVDTKWWPWAQEHRRAQPVQRVYDQLYRIRGRQQQLGERCEVVLGLGVLSWRTPDTQEVLRHLIVAAANVVFDAPSGVITIGPAGDGAKIQLEQDMLDPQFLPDTDELHALEAQVAEIGDRIWDSAPVDAILSGWVHAASPKGIYLEDAPSRPGPRQSDPLIHFAPALILRKRTERSYIRVFQEIIEQIETGAPIPEGINLFVTETKGMPAAGNGKPESLHPQSNSELYFPLESNKDQQRIVERLEKYSGVLVQGPPGTGKSHTIVNLVCHLLASGKRVLVTSYTARSLKVLQRYIRKNVQEISPLAVVRLGDDLEARQAMEDSVQGIIDRWNCWDREENAKKIEDIKHQLDEARRKESGVLKDLRAIREKETYDHPPRFGRYKGTLQTIALRLRNEKDALGWIEDRPGEKKEPPLSEVEFKALFVLFRDTSVDQWEIAGYRALNPESLPAPGDISALIESKSQALKDYERVKAYRCMPEYAFFLPAPFESRKRLIEEFEAFLNKVDQIRRHPHDWPKQAVTEILGGLDGTWRDLFDFTKEKLKSVADRGRWADENPLSGLAERERHRVRADAEVLLAHFGRGGGWGWWLFRSEAVKRGLYLQEITVRGRPCNTANTLKELIERLDVEDRIQLLRNRWELFHQFQSHSLAEQISAITDLCKTLEDALGLREYVVRLRAIIDRIPGLDEPTWRDLGACRQLLDCAKAVDAEQRLHEAQAALVKEHGRIASKGALLNADPVVDTLLRSLEACDAVSYRDAFSQISQNWKKNIRLDRRKKLLLQLRDSAPLLAKKLLDTIADKSWDIRSTQFKAAWDWARATAWLERLCDPAAEQKMRINLDLEKKRIRNRLKEAVAENAWAHCFKRLTEHERQHLVAWSKSVRNIGKGKGKNAPRHRRDAREHMNECRSAIPAWIMPLYLVAETITPGNDRFDVAIIDEASQSGPEALLLAYLAKKLVVVGDDKQISPTYAGVNHEDVHRLREHYIAELPHADAYGVNHSFFDLAGILYQSCLRLREHFRCMPEIIQFSNKICYSNEPLIPLRQYGSSRLLPVVSTQHIGDGYMQGLRQNTVNPPEAEAIVEEIVRMHTDDAYKDKSFGVISLLGHGQTDKIQHLLLDRLGSEEMERRQLVCGDAYTFQGDERDVVLLSMVSAPTEGRRIGTLTDEASRRRFNVAASRARDQLILFHTATLNDLSLQCFRYALLEYCQKPTVEVVDGVSVPIVELQQAATTADRDRFRPPDPFESWFELDVFLKIIARGYRVLPQYKCAGYRIDLVVEGMNGRVAVECDGDQWHGPARFKEDMGRQRVLERCGWRFWRVRGSAFFHDPDVALEDLWKTLEQEGVYPRSCELLKSPAEPANGDVVDQSANIDKSAEAPVAIDVSSRVAPMQGLFQ